MPIIRDRFVVIRDRYGAGVGDALLSGRHQSAVLHGLLVFHQRRADPIIAEQTVDEQDVEHALDTS